MNSNTYGYLGCNFWSASSSRISLTPLFLRALTTAQTFVWFLKPFFSISLFTSMWIPLPWPWWRPSTLSRTANTSPIIAAALALHDRPHSREFLSACSTVEAVATMCPLFLSTTLAVMYFKEKNNLNTYLFSKVILWRACMFKRAFVYISHDRISSSRSGRKRTFLSLEIEYKRWRISCILIKIENKKTHAGK